MYSRINCLILIVTMLTCPLVWFRHRASSYILLQQSNYLQLAVNKFDICLRSMPHLLVSHPVWSVSSVSLSAAVRCPLHCLCCLLLSSVRVASLHTQHCGRPPRRSRLYRHRVGQHCVPRRPARPGWPAHHAPRDAPGDTGGQHALTGLRRRLAAANGRWRCLLYHGRGAAGCMASLCGIWIGQWHA